MTPSREVMAQIYRRMRSLQAEQPGQMVTLLASELARLASDDARIVSPQAARCGLSVFTELGLIESTRSFSGGFEVHGFRVPKGRRRWSSPIPCAIRRGSMRWMVSSASASGL